MYILQATHSFFSYCFFLKKRKKEKTKTENTLDRFECIIGLKGFIRPYAQTLEMMTELNFLGS